MDNFLNNKPRIKDDFYTYINHEWLTTNKIPQDENTYTHFIQTQYDINDKLKKILESNIYPLGTTLYNSYLNNEYKNTYTINELKDLINLVNIVKTYEDLIIMNGRLLFINVDVLFNAIIDTDIYSSCNNILYLTQPTLGLPNRVYYHESKYNKIKQKYYDTICKIYNVLYPDYTSDRLNKIANLILSIESKISIILLDNDEQRNTLAINNKTNYSDLDELYPTLYLKLFIKTLCTLSDDIIIEENFKEIIMEHNPKIQINYFKQLEQLLKIYSIDEWKIYFKFKIILNYMNLTSKKLKDIYFDMFKKTLKGQLKPKLEWRSALSFTCNQLNDPISHIYVHNYYLAKTNDYILEMIKNIKKITKQRILNLDWMSTKTKRKAILKLHKMRVKIGYAKTQPRKYDHIVLTDSIIKNTIILNRDNNIYNFNKLNNKTNPNEWNSPAYLVNAYYNPSQNEIIFPAAILQAPFFSLSKTDIYNYANIGSVIGHEIIHGFDDQGSIYDENGTINNWWTDSDKKNYNQKVKQIIEIYNKEGINGKLTAGENIADFGSVILPLGALEYKLKRKLTNEELKEFYSSYATHWQYLVTKESAIERKLTDPHAPANLRVNIPLKHQKLFQNVFNIKEDDKLYIKSEDILNIW